MQDRFLPLKSEDKQLPPPTEAEPPLPTEASEEQRRCQVFLKQLGCTMFPLHVTRLLGSAQSAVKADKACVLAAVGKNGWALCHANNTLKGDKDVVLSAVKMNGYALQHANDTLQRNKEVMLAAVNENGLALKLLSDTFKGDKDVVLAAINRDGDAFEFVDKKARLWDEREFVLSIVQLQDFSLRYASDTLKGDKDVVLAAVNKHGNSLLYASEQLRKDREVVLAAVRNLPEALRFALGGLNQDQDFLKMVSSVVESDTVEIMFDDLSVRREGEKMSLCGALAGDSGIEIYEILPVYDGGKLSGFGVLLSQTPVWNGLCSECGKSLGPGTDWYHKTGFTCDLCEEHWLDAEDQEKFVLLIDDAKILKYIKQNSAGDDLMAYQVIPQAIFLEKPEDWEDEQTDEFKNECEKATVGWKGFDSQESMEAYLRKKLFVEATDVESSDGRP